MRLHQNVGTLRTAAMQSWNTQPVVLSTALKWLTDEIFMLSQSELNTSSSAPGHGRRWLHRQTFLRTSPRNRCSPGLCFSLVLTIKSFYPAVALLGRFSLHTSELHQTHILLSTDLIQNYSNSTPAAPTPQAFIFHSPYSKQRFEPMVTLPATPNLPRRAEPHEVEQSTASPAGAHA